MTSPNTNTDGVRRHGNSACDPPSDLTAEAAALGSLLLAPAELDKLIAAGLEARHFYRDCHQKIFRAMWRLRESGLHDFDPVTVGDTLKQHGELQDIDGGYDYLTELLESVPHAAHAEHYAKIIRGKWVERTLLYSVTDAVRVVQDPGLTLPEKIDYIEGLTAHVKSGDCPERFTLRALREKFPNLSQPVIDGLAREAETLNIVSTTKVGKSWLAYNLLLCVIMGDDWLNRFATSSGKVLLIDNELQPATLAARIRTVADAMGITSDQYADSFEVWPTRGKAPDIYAIGRMLDRVPPGTFKVILLDAKYRALPSDSSENDNAHETRFYNEVDRIAERLRAVFVLIHHSTKGGQADKRVTDVGAGAGAQSRAADAHVVLREHDEQDAVVLEAAVRSFPPVEPIGLRWSFPLWQPDDSIEVGSLKGKAKPDKTDSSYGKEIELTGDRATVLRIMGLLNTQETKTAIRDLTGLSTPRFKRAFEALIEGGAIANSGTLTKSNGVPYPAYTLNTGIGQHRAASGNSGLPGAYASHQADAPKGGASCPMSDDDAQAASGSPTGEDAAGWDFGGNAA